MDRAAAARRRYLDKQIKTRPQSPAWEEIKAARESAGLTQVDAANLLYVSLRRFQQWEQSFHPMHPIFWEAFQTRISRLRRNLDKA